MCTAQGRCMIYSRQPGRRCLIWTLRDSHCQSLDGLCDIDGDLQGRPQVTLRAAEQQGAGGAMCLGCPQAHLKAVPPPWEWLRLWCAGGEGPPQPRLGAGSSSPDLPCLQSWPWRQALHSNNSQFACCSSAEGADCPGLEPLAQAALLENAPMHLQQDTEAGSTKACTLMWCTCCRPSSAHCLRVETFPDPALGAINDEQLTSGTPAGPAQLCS